MTSTRALSVTGIALVAVTYFYFLLFAQFAFLHGLTAQGLEGSALKLVMTAMGVGGISGSLLGAFGFHKHTYQQRLLAGLGGCAIVAIFSLWAHHTIHLALLALTMGVALGMLTVTLVSSLPRLLGPRHRGLKIGMGTGLAYFAVNVPLIFNAAYTTQALLAAGVCVAGICILLFTKEVAESERVESSLRQKAGGRVRTNRCFAYLIGLFLLLVILDSAAFYIIQSSEALKSLSWGTPGSLWMNATIHLVAAVLSGYLIDRGHLLSVLLSAMILIAGGALCLQSGFLLTGASGLYVTGVSLYSTALVAASLLMPETKELIRIPLRAGLLYSIAGWFGSGLGIAVSENVNHIPAWSIVAVVALFFILFVRIVSERRQPWRSQE